MIDSSSQKQRLVERFPMLSESSQDFQQDFFAHASLLHIPKGHTVATEGSVCDQLALVLSGKVRVYKLSDTGREITLYRIAAGDSCVLTASCIMSGEPFPAIAESETDLEVIILPASKARDWLMISKPWCGFIFALVSKRLAEVITVLEEVTFLHMDERVAAYLIALAGQGSDHRITHHQIAADLGTTREVVSRVLKTFETRQYIEMGRSYLKIKELAGLQAYRHGAFS